MQGLRDFHAVWAYVAIVVNGLVGIATLVAWRVPAWRGRGLWIATAIAEGALLLQVVVGVVVAPRASELIFPVALAVQHRLTVDQVANTITVYPSMSGSIAEAARRLHSLD